MAQQENKDLVRRYFDERWNKKNYEVVDELSPGDDAEGHKAWLRRFHDALADIQVSIGDMVAEGDLVAIQWSLTGVLRQDVAGVGSTGDLVSFPGLAMLRVRDGKIVDDVAYSDALGTAMVETMG
jgi:predicted ester cyclase